MKKDIKIFKGNCLVEARYKFTLNEQRFILFAISKINKEDSNIEYSFHIKEFADLLELDVHDSYKVLRRLIKSIMRRPISFCPDSDTEIFCNWFSRVTYKRKRATIGFIFTDALTPYLFNLKEKFTAYKLRNILQLNSVYSIRLYELLKQSEWKGEHKIILSELKEMLGISEYYRLYSDFKRSVLETARKELARSDMPFKYKEIKDKQRVVALSFKLLRRRK